MSGRIRTLKPELLEDEKLSNLDAGARFLFIACILLSDDHGSFRAAPSFLAGQAFWGSRRDARKVAVWFGQLVELGLVRSYVVRGQQFGEVVNWKKHQKIDHAGARRLPTIDEADVVSFAIQAANSASGKVSETLARTSENLATDLDLDLDLDQDRERERERDALARPQMGEKKKRTSPPGKPVATANVAKHDAAPSAVPPQPNPTDVATVEAEKVSSPRAAKPDSGSTLPGADGAAGEVSPVLDNTLSAEGRRLFEAMQAHAELRDLSPRFADKLAGDSMASGQSIGGMIAAIGDAATELSARMENGSSVPASERASLVRRYVAQARRRGDRPGEVQRGERSSRSEGRRDDEPTREQIRAMYPQVVVDPDAPKPGEKVVPKEQADALLAKLFELGGRGGIPAKAVVSPRQPVAAMSEEP